MTVGDLREKLSCYPDNMEIMTKKTEKFGNVGYIHSVKSDTYGFFGADIECVLLTDEYEEGGNEK